MGNKFKNLDAKVQILSSDEMKQTKGGAYGKKSTTPVKQPSLLETLRINYVAPPSPPGTVFTYGSYYPITN
jgi:hypothetical protein